MRAYVLCGGFGTRLRSVIHDTQKAVVPVHGEPFLLHVLRQLADSPVTEVVLCAYYRADQLAAQQAFLAQQTGLSVQLVVEPEPLGTGGALLNALQQYPASERFLVLNADTFVQANGYQQLATAQGNGILAVQVDDTSRYGTLEVTAQGDLVGLHEKAASGAGLINAGVYAFEAHLFDDFAVTPMSLERDLLPAVLATVPIKTHVYAGPFIDIGTPEALQRYLTDFSRSASV